MNTVVVPHKLSAVSTTGRPIVTTAVFSEKEEKTTRDAQVDRV